MLKGLNHRAAELGHQNWSHYMSRARTLASTRRQRLALSEVSRRLADALPASPHAVYMRGDRAFKPAVVNGVEDLPAFAVGGSLLRALHRSSRPVMTTRSHRALLFDAALDSLDRGSLRRTGAIALVPLSLGRELDAFLLVGGPLAAFDPERLARNLAPVSACLRIARDGAPWPGSEPSLPFAADVSSPPFSRH